MRALPFAALVALAACAPPKPFEQGQVGDRHYPCDDYRDLEVVRNQVNGFIVPDGTSLPAGCTVIDGATYEVVISNSRMSSIDYVMPGETTPQRGWVWLKVTQPMG